MIRKLLVVVAVLSSFATPASAQPVVSEPGYCAFFYPNANCQNKGPGNPYTDPNFRRGRNIQNWPDGQTVGESSSRTRTHSPAVRRN
jgi:hypothetical protein